MYHPPMYRVAPAMRLAVLGVLALAVIVCTAAALWLFQSRAARPAPADILLYAGRGTSPGDVSAFEEILRERGWRYSTTSAAGVDLLDDAQLRAYRLIVIPGGNFVDIGNGLTASAAAKIRSAVGSGVGYLGVCAGAFFAGASPYNGLNLTGGIQFPFYALEARGTRKAPVLVTATKGEPVEVYWEDGPQLTGWGEAVARYPDGTPAVAQGRFGQGWVVLAGIHAEAPASWRRNMDFTQPAGVSRAYAVTLIEAALDRKPLPRD